ARVVACWRSRERERAAGPFPSMPSDTVATQRPRPSGASPQPHAQKQIPPRLPLRPLREPEPPIQPQRGRIVLVRIELDPPAPALPRALQGRLDQRRPTAPAAGRLLDEQVLEPAVGRGGPDAQAEAQLTDAGRRAVVVGAGEQVLDVGLLDEPL